MLLVACLWNDRTAALLDFSRSLPVNNNNGPSFTLEIQLCFDLNISLLNFMISLRTCSHSHCTRYNLLKLITIQIIASPTEQTTLMVFSYRELSRFNTWAVSCPLVAPSTMILLNFRWLAEFLPHLKPIDHWLTVSNCQDLQIKTNIFVYDATAPMTVAYGFHP